MAELRDIAVPPRQPGRRSWLRLIVAIGISSLSLAWFIGAADRSALIAAWGALSPGLFAVASIMFFMNIAIRGFRLMLLSADHGTLTGFFPWLRLSVVHQIAFMVLPSGFGDFGFPILAKRIVGLAGTSAARTVLIYRLQDVWVLLVIGIVGLILISGQIDRQPAGVVAVLLLTGAGLVWSSDLARWAAIVVARMLNWLVLVLKSRRFDRLCRGLAGFAESVAQPIATRRRLLAALAAVGCWSAAAAAAWVIFDMIGTSLEPVEILIIVAGLNLAGAFASFTVAGFGVSEGGLAGALMLLGFGAPEAVAIALVARPLLLINALSVCGVVECAFRFVRRPRPITGRAATLAGSKPFRDGA